MVVALCIMPFAFAQYPLLLLPWILAQYGLIPHRMRFFTLVLGFFQLFHIHMCIRLRNHWSMLVSDVFVFGSFLQIYIKTYQNINNPNFPLIFKTLEHHIIAIT